MSKRRRQRVERGEGSSHTDPHSEWVDAMREDEIAYRRFLAAGENASAFGRTDGFFRWVRYLAVAASGGYIVSDFGRDLGLASSLAIGAAMSAVGAVIGYYDGLAGRGIFTVSAHGAQVRRLQAEVDVYFAAVSENMDAAAAVPWPESADCE